MYYVYDDGRVYSEITKKFVKCYQDNRGYKRIYIGNKMYSVHRLVLIHFDPIDNPSNYVVNHIDENPSNNLLDNLEWVSQRENIMKYYYSTSVSEKEKVRRFNLMMKPSGSLKEYNPDKQELSFSGIMSLKLCGINTKIIADNFGVSTRRIQQIVKQCEDGY